jgi:hypothetical protein
LLLSWLRSLPEPQTPPVRLLLTQLSVEGKDASTYPLPASDLELCSFSSASPGLPLPGLRVWRSLLSAYSDRGAWRQTTAILEYLKATSAPDCLAYHRVIASLCFSNDLASHSLAMDYFAEMRTRGVAPHPLSLAAVLRSLSSWSREGVAYIDSLAQIAELVCSTCVQLTRLTDEQFLELYVPPPPSSHNDPFYYEALDSDLGDRQRSVDAVLTQLMVSLAGDRGLTLFAHSLRDHLLAQGVELPHEAIFALIQVPPCLSVSLSLTVSCQGYCAANRWRDGLVLYQELSEKGVQVHGSRAYHWIADAMIRTNSRAELLDFVCPPEEAFEQ